MYQVIAFAFIGCLAESMRLFNVSDRYVIPVPFSRCGRKSSIVLRVSLLAFQRQVNLFC